jgi:sugar O-acyltransferase (sialic acid O-acetyltransferase NeuD family)
VTPGSDSLQQKHKTLLVFGAGGHGRVVAEAALLQGLWGGLLASSRPFPAPRTELLRGVKLVDMDDVGQVDMAIHIAIGNNTARQTEAQAFGFDRLVSVVHPRACVSDFAQLAAGCFVAATAVVAPLAVLGVGVLVNHGAVVDHDTEVGAFSHIAQHASVCGHAKLGLRVLIGSGAVVLSSVVLGDDVVLSPGSVASCDLPGPGLYSGIPAVKIQ